MNNDTDRVVKKRLKTMQPPPMVNGTPFITSLVELWDDGSHAEVKLFVLVRPKGTVTLSGTPRQLRRIARAILSGLRGNKEIK